MMRWGRHPYGAWVLGVLSFLESIIFPLPIDPLLVWLVLAQRARGFFLAALCTLCSVAGAAVACAIGAWASTMLMELWPEVGQSFVEAQADIKQALSKFLQSGPLVVSLAVGFVGALTPMPLKGAAFGTGMMALPVTPFLLGCLVGRALRYFTPTVLIVTLGKRHLKPPKP